ncbi:MAG: hypothetical protein QOE89_37, partial [Pseudonocardiales bacterium]|nr:hypothetical protein [Pseudonocardiales bacterium]
YQSLATPGEPWNRYTTRNRVFGSWKYCGGSQTRALDRPKPLPQDAAALILSRIEPVTSYRVRSVQSFLPPPSMAQPLTRPGAPFQD